MTSSILPSGWLAVALPDVIFFQEGPGLRKFQYRESGVPFINIRTIVNGKIDKSICKFLSLDEVEKKYQHFLLEPEDIVCSTSGTIGKTAEISAEDLPLMLNTSVIRFRELAPNTIERSYLHAFLKSNDFLLQTEAKSTGTAQKNIGPTHLKTFLFTLPPLAEQKVIADKLDTLLAQVENTKAHLERIPQILKRFRQSVLAAAVSGRLTGTPEEKFKIIPIEHLAKPQRYSLGIGPFGSNLKVSDYREAGHPLVFVREIRANQFGDDATKYVSGEKFNELKAHRAVPGDILITKMGDPPGDVAIYPLDRPEAVITADCIKLSVDEPIYCRDYVAYAMQSEQFRRDVLSISAGVAQQKVNLTKFRKLTLRVPPKMEQTEIVRRVDQLFAHADRIEQQVNNALARVNNLTQSILAKAFRGELTEQWRKDNPELISGENSAEALLERIKAERAAMTPVKKTRNQRL